MLEEMVVSQLANGQVNMAMGQNFVTNSFSFWRIGCATCGQTVSWRRTGPILSTNAGCKLCSFQCVSPICWACFSDVMVSPGFRKLQWIRRAADHQSDHDFFFGASLALGSALECLLRPTGDNRLKIHCENPLFSERHNRIEKWSIVVA